MKRKFNKFRLAAVLLIIVVLSACSISSIQNGGTDVQQADIETTANGNADEIVSKITSEMISYDEDDIYTEWEDQNPSYIKLNGTGASITGPGAVADGGKVTITAAGTYAVSGKLNDGQIIVDVEDEGTVRLVLNGAEINCSDSAPIYVKNAEKTIVSLPEGTQNTITDGSQYVLSDAESDEPSAAVFSKDDLTINGTGGLTVRANYNDGIASKDDLKITGGTIQIVSVDDGLIGKDMVLVKEGNISIEAGGDGIKSTNDADAEKGFIAIEGGTFDIKAGADGIQAETSMLITDGAYTISTGGGSANAPVKVNDMGFGQRGAETTASTTSETENESAKAVKAASDITITGGTFSIDSYDDAIHSNGSIGIAGGDISIASGDDGIHADASIVIADGKIDIQKSYEGIESMIITVSDGEIYVTASDDGINVNGGNDGSSVNGRPGQNAFAVSENSKLNINGGYISVNASGDGLDSNGSIFMTGGKVVVSGPTNSGNGAIDYNGDFEMSGGVLIAAGSSGMAQAPSEQSTQSAILMYYSTLQQAGTLVSLKDSEGNTVAAFEPEKEYQSVVISSPELKKDGTYTLYSGETKVVDFTVSDSVTWLSETGVTTQKGFSPGGGNGPGSGAGRRAAPPDGKTQQ